MPSKLDIFQQYYYFHLAKMIQFSGWFKPPTSQVFTYIFSLHTVFFVPLNSQRNSSNKPLNIMHHVLLMNLPLFLWMLEARTWGFACTPRYQLRLLLRRRCVCGGFGFIGGSSCASTAKGQETSCLKFELDDAWTLERFPGCSFQ